MAVTNVMNAQILDALRVLGYVDRQASLPSTGSQSSSFPARLRAAAGVTREQFAEGLALARSLVDRGVPGDVMDEFKRAPLDSKQTGTPMDLFYQIAERRLGGQDPTKLNNLRSALGSFQGAKPPPAVPPTAGSGPGARGQGGGPRPGPAPAPPPPTPAGIPTTIPTDRAGIMNLQRLLNERGANLKVDGIAGPATRAAHAQYGRGTAVAPPPAPPPGETLAGSLGGDAGAGGGGAPGAPAPPPPAPPLAPNASDAEVEGFIRRNFGFAAWALDEPDLRRALVDFTRQMGGQEFTEDQLDAHLTANSSWWRDKRAAAQQRTQLRHEHPGDYNLGIDSEMGTLRKRALEFGVNVTDQRLRQIAQTSYEMGWTEQERNAALSAEFDYSPDTGAQSASIVVGELKKRAKSFLLPISESTIDRWGQQIIAGTASYALFDEHQKKIAQTMFPVFGKEIEAGIPMSDLIYSYKEAAGKYLEMDGDAIDWTDPKWMRTLETTDKDGRKGLRGVADFTDLIRTDEQYGWDKTKNARAHAAKLAGDLAKQFGSV